jgi:hypothetical protein
MTAAEAQKMTGVEKAMALDVLDADGVDRLTEDEGGIFIPDPLFEDVPAYMYGLPEYEG